ncbi:DUF1190 domain-containing protein [Pseudomonas aegrilactucae]|uniref:DUF1190 domain-containing protein n=1 Tax=Pseudomonas aegrilactucae TaxID=2854028 RepID=A0A9Q2XLE0_9PSED|nr:DUF1190 domain-containing protein [Pseudomonas aegrilactucae]MBV6288861.1 DUF1190 domain-containing protein [Pseudomonas aegrilactucae]
MKRSKSIRLIALGSLPLALAACDSERSATSVVSEVKRYPSVDACAMTGVPLPVCHGAWSVAKDHHDANAPRFVRLEDCLGSFEQCEPVQGATFHVPRMEGFALTTERQVYDDGYTHSGGGGQYGGGGRYDYVNVEPRYLSEAIYHEREGRDGFKASSLTDQVNSGNQYAGLVEDHAPSSRFNASGDAHAQVLPARFMASARPWTVGSHSGFAAHVPGRGGFGFGS